MTKRIGVIAKKLGITQFTANGGIVTVATLISLDTNIIIAKRVQGDLFSTQLGIFNKKFKIVNKNINNIFYKLNLFPKNIIKDFSISDTKSLTQGDRIGIDFFRRNQYVDISGVSIGKGFSGVIKRHNFRGLSATHGVSVSHRSHGSVGQCQDPGKVFKGKKMAGQLGCENVTLSNIQVIDIDYDLHILSVKGAIPGSNNQFLYIRDSLKKTYKNYKCI